MFFIIFEIYYGVVDIIVTSLYLNTVFGKAKKIPPVFYWLWLCLCEIIPLPASYYFFGTYTTLKTIVLVTLCFVMIFMMTFLYESAFRHRLLASVFYVVLTGVCEDIPGTILTIVSDRYFHLSMEQIEQIVQAQYAFCLLFMVAVIRAFFRKKERRFTLKYSIALIITPLLSLVIMGDTSQMSVLDTSYKISILTKSTSLFIINIINFILLDNFFTIQNLEEEKVMLCRQVSYQTSKYSQISAAYRSTRSILHDTKKHFKYLQQCVKLKETESSIPYMERAIQEMEGTYNKINTGNLVIDSFLSSHLEIAGQKGISYTTDINVKPELIPIEDYDLSIILGNLLDNALEECSKIEPLENSRIHVKILTSDKAFMFNIVNSSTQKEKDFTRRDSVEYSLYHGYGLENVRKIIKKYHGSYDFQQKGQCFDAAVRIPVIKSVVNNLCRYESDM